MHNNYYFLRKLCDEIRPALTNSVISECFSQSKDELVIRLETATTPLFIRASLVPGFPCLSFPEEFARARRNSVDLFNEMIGLRVELVKQYDNERSFALLLSDGYLLLFKMHGNHSNIVLFQKDKAVQLFRSQLLTDLDLNPATLDRSIDFSRQAFNEHINSLEKLYFTFGKVIWTYLNTNGFNTAPAEEKWTMIQSLLGKLEHPEYIVTEMNHKLVLSLVPIGDIRLTYPSALEALNSFFANYSSHSALHREKQLALSKLHTQLKNCEGYIAKTQQKLNETETDDHYRRWADLVMANLHAIQPGSGKVILPDFLDENKPIEIKLKSELSAQKNAEVFYRKSRNHHIEIANLKEGIERKEKLLADLQNQFKEISSTSDLKELRRMTKVFGLSKVDESQQPNLPYRSVEFNGFVIWIGRSAKENDELTLKYAYKEDLWLHARDVPGSHVIIKFQAGRAFPKEVIEKAARLAAYYSKRKNETLCPVIYTPKKFVRKRKGDAPGMVVVEKEKVIMVEPSA